MQEQKKRGPGRPCKPVLDLVAAGTYKPSRHGARLCEALGVETLEEAHAKIGLPAPKSAPPRSASLVDAILAVAAALDRIADRLAA